MSLANSSLCWFDVDPESLAVQIVGYCSSAIVVGHAIPTLVKVCRTKDPSHVPLGSLISRIVLSLNTGVFGLLICQPAVLASGFGSLVVLLPIAAMNAVYTQAKKVGEMRQSEPSQTQKEDAMV